MVSFQRYVAVSAAALGLWGAAMGCGGGDSKPASYASIVDEIESPTGTVSETTVTKIGEKFEAASQSAAFGVRDDQTAQSGSATVSVDCPEGGKYTVTGSGNQSSGRATANFNDCCFSAGCCASGNGNMYYSSDQSAEYNYCASYDMDYSCEGQSASVEYSGCFNLGGEAVILVEVDGDSYAVSGSRSNGTGTLTIRGANGSWTCTFSSGSGNCSSSAGGSFSFSRG